MLTWQALLVGAEHGSAAHARNHADGLGRAWVQIAVDDALRDVQETRCLSLFEDYSDRDGILLRRKLQGLGVTPQEYLTRWVWFLEGSHQPQCRDRNIAAFTVVGARIVYVCSSRIVANHIADGDTVVIHEMLHSLGLGENPPSAREITERVHARCRR